MGTGSTFAGPARQRALALALVALALVGVAALFAGRDDPATNLPIAEDDPGPLHVHGLGRNPRDGALFIATHTGTWRLPEGAAAAQRVGESRQDTMGFTVVGADRFLGSGHPDAREMAEKGTPSQLGLIKSTDAGRSWEPVSLLGQADFHILRAAGQRIYGVDSFSGRLLVSPDFGRTWSRHALPSPVFDLIPHPRRPSVVLAATEGGLQRSENAGRTWKRVSDGVGLLAWPESDLLYLVSQGGQLFESPDAGARWRQVGTVPGESAALLGEAGDLYAALHDGTIVHSADGGASWVTSARP